MKTTLYFVRHGQSEGNLQDLFCGHTDAPLTDLGRRQARGVASYFDSIHVDAIYASDLIRAYDTALPLSEKKGISIMKSEGLREIFAGQWEGMPFPELLKTPMGRVWWEDTGLATPVGGESVAALQARIVSEVSRIARENEGKSVCIFTHFTPIYALRTHWAGVPLEEMKRMPKPPNASVTVAEYENGVFSALVKFGDTSHLKHLECAMRG